MYQFTCARIFNIDFIAWFVNSKSDPVLVGRRCRLVCPHVRFELTCKLIWERGKERGGKERKGRKGRPVVAIEGLVAAEASKAPSFSARENRER